MQACAPTHACGLSTSPTRARQAGRQLCCFPSSAASLTAGLPQPDNAMHYRRAGHAAPAQPSAGLFQA